MLAHQRHIGREQFRAMRRLPHPFEDKDQSRVPHFTPTLPAARFPGTLRFEFSQPVDRLMTEAIKPFRIHVDETVLTDLQSRLSRARFATDLARTDWCDGTNTTYLRDVVEYWRNKYDWRKHETELNQLPNFVTMIEGQRIHFIHARSTDPDAIPLLMLHGWPGSIVEFLDVVGPLTDPEAHGGRRKDGYHLILPSLPGFGFSGPTVSSGWNPRKIAGAFAILMARLGYGRYVVHGGDWGAMIGDELASQDEGHVAGLHTTMAMAPPTADTLSAEELDDQAVLTAFHAREDAYAILQGTKPQTIGAALNDTPLGLCAWILEKFHSWTDHDGLLDSVIDRDRFLTNVTIYWVTETAVSAARLYFEFFRTTGIFNPDVFAQLPTRINVPTAVARFPKEVVRTPTSWLMARYNLVRCTSMPKGGHFAAMEQPALLVSDIRAFVRSLISQPTS